MSRNYRSQLIQECFGRLPVSVQQKSDAEIRIVESGGSGLKAVKWKSKPVSLGFFKKAFEPFLSHIALQKNEVLIRDSISDHELLKLYHSIVNRTELLYRENLTQIQIWGEPNEPNPSGFKSDQTLKSNEILENLYRDDFVVKEKKAFVLDLERSKGAYMVSIEPEKNTIIDAAAQIASLSVGFNDPLKDPMALRPEILDPNLDTEDWDVYKALRRILTEESGLPHCYVVNSGAEAVETAYRACRSAYPARRRILAFEGSFHGRTLLSLHSTYNPAKREPFEIFKDLVTFLPFPELKSSSPEALNPKEPDDWVKIWSHAKNKDIPEAVEPFLKGDEQLALETKCLLKIREEILQAPPICVIVEPIQCEGGDKYGSARFFRALRLLTRNLDTALVFDEVQAGLGLGGSFFWHQGFGLTDEKGNEDHPDALCLAKKTQVGVCLSRFEIEVPLETSAASLYRGYIQARSIQTMDSEKIEKSVKTYIGRLEKLLDPELIQNSRCKGLAFAFDLPSADLLKEFVNQRFENGTLFYPAGDVTARFRLLATVTERELAHVFTAIYKCYLSLSQKKKIYQVPQLEEWLKLIPLKDLDSEKVSLPWPKELIPNSKASYLALSQDDWISIFRILAKRLPQLLRSPASQEIPLNELYQKSKEEFWKRYEEDESYCLLDLLWQSSRTFGFQIKRLNREEIGKRRDQIGHLEKTVYEPERQDDPELFYEISKDPQTIVLVALDAQDKICGICAAAPLSYFPKVSMVSTDPLVKSKRALYSMDVAVMPDVQGKGLGLRFKCEQYVEAYHQGTQFIRSRNRQPQAAAMMNINHKLSSVTLDMNPIAYGGRGTAYYQSISMHRSKKNFGVFHPYLAPIRNKGSLANFVTPTYLTSLEVLRDFLPERLRHIYLSSGRCESIDKLVKLLRSKRSDATVCLSFEGDTFGSNTASARSLGGDGSGGFFSWPVFKYLDGASASSDLDRIKGFESQLEPFDTKKVLGLFIEPFREEDGEYKGDDFLHGVLEICKKKDIPVLFDETASFHVDDEHKRPLLTSDTAGLKPDGVFFYPGHQLGVVAVTKDLFNEKPLTLISTWDGDDFSLLMLREKLLSRGSSPDAAS